LRVPTTGSFAVAQSGLPWPLLRLATLFSPLLRALFEMRYV